MSLLAAALGEHEDDRESLRRARGATARRFMEERAFQRRIFRAKASSTARRGDRSFVDVIEGRSTTCRRKGDATPAAVQSRRPANTNMGKGCLSDGVIGAWMAEVYGVGTPLDAAQDFVKNLRAIHRHNFRADLSTPRELPAARLRAGRRTRSGAVFVAARGQADAALSRTATRCGRASSTRWLPTWSPKGWCDEGLEIVRAARSRYDGSVRNPWNEYECGNYYARAMASYALLAAFSGFRYSAVERTLWFGPQAAPAAVHDVFLRRHGLRHGLTRGAHAHGHGARRRTGHRANRSRRRTNGHRTRRL